MEESARTLVRGAIHVIALVDLWGQPARWRSITANNNPVPMEAYVR
jgi:hypothetical protein